MGTCPICDTPCEGVVDTLVGCPGCGRVWRASAGEWVEQAHFQLKALAGGWAIFDKHRQD